MLKMYVQLHWDMQHNGGMWWLQVLLRLLIIVTIKHVNVNTII